MRTVPALTLLLAIASMSCAAAQSDSVIVNSMGATSGGQVLYDPGTGQERVVPPLLQPWQNEPVRLHPPRKHAARHAATPAPEAPSSYASSAPETSAPVAAPVRKKRRTTTAAAAPAPAAPAAPQKSAPVSGFSDFTDLISQPPSAQIPAAPPPKKAAPAPKPARKVAEVPPPEPPRVEKPVEKPAPVEKPVQKASIEPAHPAKSRSSTGTPRDSITFAPNASDPSTTAVAAIRSLAGSLSSALADGNARIQLMAYAGMRGEKSSDTRRLSLKRALVIRQLLIDDGVPSERIDVFALGGADDGPLDRVDVFVKS